MSAIEELKRLDEQRTALLNSAKSEALQKAEEAVTTLNDLGFNYKLVLDGQEPKQTRTRRPGIRKEVLDFINRHPSGTTRLALLEYMQAKGNKQAEQSISNAVAALKRNGEITTDSGTYTPTTQLEESI